MSKTKNWIMDMEDEYYTIADKVIGECECYEEFYATMQEHKNLMTALYSDDEIDDMLSEIWYEKWSKYVA